MNNMLNPDLLGTLIVVILKAKNLPDKHTFSKQDPFAEVSLGANGKAQRTKVDLKGGQHPLWDEEFRLEVMKDASGRNRTLTVKCYAKEPRGDDVLGEATVDITETLQTGEFDDWVMLSNNNLQRGEVYLEMTFYAAGPSPLNRRATKMKQSDRMSRIGGEVGLPAFNGPQSSPESAPNLAPIAPLKVSPKVSPHGSKTSSPNKFNSALPNVPKDDFVPPFLRPGNPNSPPQFVPETKPLPPNDPMHTRASDLQRVASPPVGASAYPPASAPNPAFSSPPLPASLLPARPSPGAYGQSTSPAPMHQRTSSYGSGPSPSPFPTPGHTRTGSHGSPPAGGFAGGFGFPAAQVPASGPSDYGYTSSYNNTGYGAPAAPSFPSTSNNTYGPPSHMPGGWPSDYSSASTYPGQAPPEPALPDPFAPRHNTLSPDLYHGQHHPTMNIPQPSRSPLGFRLDESDVMTPKADLQPRHSPAAPISHLRHEATAPREPDAGRYQNYSGYSSQGARYGAADRDAEAAMELERRERERASKLSEQEERDLELARKLDYELNAN